MTKKITTSLLLLMLFVGIKFSNAQLAGTYTVGGTTPDYATPTDAILALNAQGISAPVVFNIRDGVYTGKLVLTAVTGATFTNTVTFQSENADSTLVTITAASAISGLNNYTVQLSGADYITFKQVTIERSGTAATSRVIDIGGGSDYNNFLNCVITNGSTASSNNLNALVYSAPGSTDNYNVFSDNVFNNGSYGFYFFGGSAASNESGNMIMNNNFMNQYAYGIQTSYESELEVMDNYFTSSSTVFGSVVYMGSCISNTLVTGNKIELLGGGSGINLNQCNGGAGELVVANNFISVSTTAGGTQAYGIRLSQCVNTGIYFNNVNIISVVTVASNYALNATTGGTNVKVLNNVFATTGGYVVGITNSAITQMNYNDLFSTGANFGQFSGTNYTTLATWQAASTFDANSVNINPNYISATDLHIQTFALNANAVPAGNILTDIDGDVRDVTTPDIGADETTPPSNDVGVTKLLAPLAGSCGSSTTTVAAIVRNYAAVPQTNITVYAEITGTQTITLTGIITDTINVYKSDTVYFTPTINTLMGDSLTIKMYTSILNDEDLTNDTLEVDSVYINPIPAAPVVPATVNACVNNPVNITATYPVNQNVYWYSTPTGGIPIQSGSPLTVIPNSDTTFYAEVRDTTIVGGGCLRITECELNDVSTAGGDYLEIQNLSGSVIDATGWVVAVGNSYTDINLVNPTTWALGVFNPGEIQFRNDGSGPNSFGANFLWTGGANLGGWVMIVDNMGVVQDFVVWDYPLADLQTMSVVVNGFTITPAANWNGAMVSGCATGSVTRIGSTDNDNAADWACEPETENFQNASMSAVFTGCGSGACPSDRVPVVVKVSQPPVVNLGNDTIIALPNTLPLDAGLGFITYLWSTGATTQNITVTASGTYTVTVSDAVGCTGSDAILVTVLTGINDFGANSSITISPVPATNYLKVTLSNLVSDNYKIALLNNLGQPALTATLSVQSNTAEKAFDLSGLPKGVYYVEVKSDKGIYHQRVLVQ